MPQNLPSLGPNIFPLCRNEHCFIYRVTDKTGEGQMTCYPVFPGILLSYMDFHLEQCQPELQNLQGALSIHHCREGRIEWEFEKNQFIYLEAGDLQIGSREHYRRHFRFPLHHYHGLTVSIFPDQATETLTEFLTDYGIDLPELIRCTSCWDKPFIMRAGAGIAHIFSELYDVPEKIRSGYHKIKVLELLLFLSTLDISEKSGEHPYFHRSHVEKIREIQSLLEKDLHHHYTLEELSCQFEIGLTTMKQCFKAVYGVSIYSYMRTYRMNAAAVLLRRGDCSVGQVAALMGYENASKFSAAFREVIGLTPREYRRSDG